MSTGTDALSRALEFARAAGPFAVLAGLVVIAAVVYLAVTDRRLALVGVYLVALMFSGFETASLDAGSALLRWVVLALLAATALRGAAYPGAPAVLIAVYGVLGIVTAPLAPSLSWAAQFGVGLLLLAGAAAPAVSRALVTGVHVRVLLELYRVAAAVFVVLGLAFLPTLRAGGRYSGGLTSAALFVMTGGVLLPFVVWMWLDERRRTSDRAFSACLIVAIAFLLVLSGQRTGTFAGAIATLPLLLGARLRGAVKVGAAALLAAIAIHAFLVRAPEQAAFVQSRYESTGVTGRTQRWEGALDLIEESPVVGAGMGAEDHVPFGFHNAFLRAWYEGGLPGIVLFASAFLILLVQTAGLAYGRWPEEVRGVGKLLLGTVAGLLAGAFFEVKLMSASNILIFTAILASVVRTRLASIAAEAESSQTAPSSPSSVSFPAGRPARGGSLWPRPFVAPRRASVKGREGAR